MGNKESNLKDQAWCSNTLNCKNCMTEVENVNTEIKRTSPIPRSDLQNLINQQKHQSSQKSSHLLQKNENQLFGAFQDNEQKQELKYAFKSENRLQILQQIKDKSQKLQLKVLSSAYLEKGQMININVLGLDGNGSLRNQNDGFVYFGCKKSIKKFKPNTSKLTGTTGGSQNEYVIQSKNAEDDKLFSKEVVNDFVIPTKNEEEKEKHRGRQFQIYYDIERQKYRIRDLGVGYGAFVKLSKPLVLRDNFLLNMGESYIVANLLKPSDELIGISVPQKLRLKIFSVQKADQPDIFCCQNQDQEIVIGRTPNCDIRIEDKLLSKAQAVIKFESGSWILQDGFEGKESTNGSWLYLNEDCDIEENMVFKSNQTFFEAHLI